jgi:hypothetical protein
VLKSATNLHCKRAHKSPPAAFQFLPPSRNLKLYCVLRPGPETIVFGGPALPSNVILILLLKMV